MTIRDSIGCEFEAKPSSHPGGMVWLDTVIDDEIEQHQITPDDAEALAAELIKAARQARLDDGQAFADGARGAQLDAQPPIGGLRS